MGNLAEDTAVEGGDGRFVARLSDAWEIWGPNGGYLASVALRAAGAHSAFDRPATFTCHYLSVARFDEVQIDVRTLRRAKRAESVAVTISQDDVHVLEALVWLVADGDGLAHDFAPMPDVEHHATLPHIRDLLPPDAPQPPFKFWLNFDHKPFEFVLDPADRAVGEARFRGWYRYADQATFDDPLVDACRSLVLLDTMSWPAAVRAHPWPLPWMAPSLDLAVQFHRAAPQSEWLLVEAVAPVAEDGLIGFRANVWSDDGRLLGSGSGQLLCRPVPG